MSEGGEKEGKEKETGRKEGEKRDEGKKQGRMKVWEGKEEGRRKVERKKLSSAPRAAPLDRYLFSFKACDV